MKNNVVHQYTYLFSQISRMTEALFKHDSGEHLLDEQERAALIKIRKNEFEKLTRIMSEYPDAHDWYREYQK